MVRNRSGFSIKALNFAIIAAWDRWSGTQNSVVVPLLTILQVQRKPRRKPWFCPKCRRANFEVEQGIVSEGLETGFRQRKRSKMSKKGVLGNIERKPVERRESADKEEMMCLTEKEKWEATEAQNCKKGQGG